MEPNAYLVSSLIIMDPVAAGRRPPGPGRMGVRILSIKQLKRKRALIPTTGHKSKGCIECCIAFYIVHMW